MQRKAEHKQKLREAMQAGQHILIDLDFDGEMTEDQVRPLIEVCSQSFKAHKEPMYP